jgi:hypothetical protein
MSTIADVKRLIRSFPLQHPEMTILGRMIAISPVRHVLRSLFIDGSSGKGAFKPYWGMFPLCIPTRGIYAGYGFYLWNHAHGPWNTDKPDAATVLLDEIERNALPILRPVQTLQDFMIFMSTYHDRDRLYGFPHMRIILESALGNLDAARTIWTSELSKWTERHYLHFDGEPENMRRRQALGACLMADDRAGIAALLHEFEVFTVTSNKLEKIWQRTPFPVEL